MIALKVTKPKRPSHLPLTVRMALTPPPNNAFYLNSTISPIHLNLAGSPFIQGIKAQLPLTVAGDFINPSYTIASAEIDLPQIKLIEKSAWLTHSETIALCSKFMGWPTKVYAENFGISPLTAAKHIENLKKKLCLRQFTAAFLYQAFISYDGIFNLMNRPNPFKQAISKKLPITRKTQIFIKKILPPINTIKTLKAILNIIPTSNIYWKIIFCA